MFRNRRSGRFRFFVLVFVFFGFLCGVVHGLLFYSDDSFFDYYDGDDGVVILTASSGALGFGHTALLFSNNGSWFYFSWQSSKVVFSEVPISVLSNFSSFNSWIREVDSVQNYIADYDSAIFVRGDFVDSIRVAEFLFYDYLGHDYLNDSVVDFSLFGKNSGYDLFFNNCVVVSYSLLSEGFIGNSSFEEFMVVPSLVSNVASKQFEAFLDYELFFS
ncbi:hypothetical protein KO361_06140 [Candidatus Woesearchaeota archaeon]|nr:hypothetical protein [Candidatus Woesearchaeota archaeon]